MARFTPEQAFAVTEVQQLLNDWAYETDMHNGVHMGEYVTEDCYYFVAGAPRRGRAELEQYYVDRLARLSSQPAGVPTHRHNLSNLRVSFLSGTEVSITFSLIYFSTAGMAPGVCNPDPLAVADVRMNCRRETDGEWLISKFDSNQPFHRVQP